MEHESGPSQKDKEFKNEGTETSKTQIKGGKFSWDYKGDAQRQAKQNIIDALHRTIGLVGVDVPEDKRREIQKASAFLTIEESIGVLAKKIVSAREALKRSEDAGAKGESIFPNPLDSKAGWNQPEIMIPIMAKDLAELENALSQLQHLSDKNRTIAEMIDELDPRKK